MFIHRLWISFVDSIVDNGGRNAFPQRHSPIVDGTRTLTHSLSRCAKADSVDIHWVFHKSTALTMTIAANEPLHTNAVNSTRCQSRIQRRGPSCD
jgi:hypothetical protein